MVKMKRVFIIFVAAVLFVFILALAVSCIAQSLPPAGTEPTEPSTEPPTEVPTEPPTEPTEPAESADPPPPLERFSLSEIYSRYYPEVTLELIPSEEYGEIYPYIGAASDQKYLDDPCIYGFCDAEGKIICDPVYIDVNVYEDKNKSVYVFRRAYGNREEVVSFDKVYVAASDGSFVQEFDDVRRGYDGTIAVKKDDKWGAVDYDGNKLLPFKYQHAMIFREGLAAVTEDFEKGYKYVDKSNNTVIGSLPPIEKEHVERRERWRWEEAYRSLFFDLSFKEERAVFFDSGKYGFIDKTGKKIIPAIYDDDSYTVTGFENGRAVVSEEKKSTLIDKDGTVIISFVEHEIYKYDDNVFKVSAKKDPKKSWLIDQNGMVITNYVPNKDDNLALGEDRFLVRASGYSYKIIDSSGNIYFESEEYQDVFFESGHIIVSKVGRSPPMGVLNPDGEYILAPIYREIRAVKDKLLVWQGMYGGLMDSDGQWIIKVSMLEYLED